MKFVFILFVLFALYNCKLILKTKNVGREVLQEETLLKIEYRGSCADFKLIASQITVNPIDYSSASLTAPTGAPASPTKGCLPFFLTEAGIPTDYDNLVAHYVCSNQGEGSSLIEVVEVFNNNPVSINFDRMVDKEFCGTQTTINTVDGDWQACEDACAGTASCVGYSHRGASCELYRSYADVANANGYKSGLKIVTPGTVDEHATVEFILGVSSNKPFRSSQATAFRRPTCGTSKKYCEDVHIVNSCTSNSPSFKKEWIVNKDVVYLLPNSYSAKAPSDCKSSTVCCSYLPSDAALTAYANNLEKGYCFAPTNNETFELKKEEKEKNKGKGKGKGNNKNHKQDDEEEEEEDDKKRNHSN